MENFFPRFLLVLFIVELRWPRGRSHIFFLETAALSKSWIFRHSVENGWNLQSNCPGNGKALQCTRNSGLQSKMNPNMAWHDILTRFRVKGTRGSQICKPFCLNHLLVFPLKGIIHSTCRSDWGCIFLTITIEPSWGTFLHQASFLPHVGKMKGTLQTDSKPLSTHLLVYRLAGIWLT